MSSDCNSNEILEYLIRLFRGRIIQAHVCAVLSKIGYLCSIESFQIRFNYENGSLSLLMRTTRTLQHFRGCRHKAEMK